MRTMSWISLQQSKLRVCKFAGFRGERCEKKVGIFWSARIGLRYRVIGKERAEGLVWFSIGRHDRYEAILKS